MKKIQTHSVSRRSVVKAFATGTLLSFPPLVGYGEDSTPVSGEWTFTDDKGVTVTLSSVPERVAVDVNAAGPLWDFGIRPQALFGWNVQADGSLGDSKGNINPEGIQIVGDVTEPVRIEELIAIDPDLIVTLTWFPDDPQEYWSLDSAAGANLELVQDVAPIIAISATRRADENALRYAELAGALGADLESPVLLESEEDFHAAIENFKSVAADEGALSVLFLAPLPDNANIANPVNYTDLNMFRELGMNVIVPDVSPSDFWETFSHEQALKYPSDIIFVSTRSNAYSLKEMTDSPTWSHHPAVAAGQIYPWQEFFINSYQGVAEVLNETAQFLSVSEKVT